MVKWAPFLFLYGPTQLLLETAENRNFGTESERNACCTEQKRYFSVWRAFELTYLLACWNGSNGFCDTTQTKKCDKIAWQKIGEPKGLADFLSRLLWSLVRSEKILSRRNKPVALVYSTCWQFFLQSKHKFCLVRPAPNLRIARQLLEHYLKQLTVIQFSEWPRGQILKHSRET